MGSHSNEALIRRRCRFTMPFACARSRSFVFWLQKERVGPRQGVGVVTTRGDAKTGSSGTRPRLLLVIPNAQLQAALGVAVQAFARVDLAASAGQALEAAAMSPPDVSVVDADISDMLCVQLARALL